MLNTGSNAITNEAGATLEAKSGATLEIDSDVSNTGATIKADDGGTLELVNDTITGGTIALNGATHGDHAADRGHRHALRRHDDDADRLRQ